MKRNVFAWCFWIFLILCLGSLSGGCECSDVGNVGSPPQIEVDPKSLVFEALTLGSQRVQSISVKNTGGDVLEITEIRIVNETANKAFSFTKRTETPLDLKPSDTIRIAVRYSPKVAGIARGHIRIVSNATNSGPGGVVKVPLRSAEVSADISATPNPMDFGSAKPDKKKVMTLTIQNRGKANLVLSAFKFKSNKEKQFTIEKQPKLPATVKPNGKVLVEIGYKPTAPFASESLFITNNSNVRNYEVKLVGKSSAAGIEIIPPRVVFDKVKLGSKGTKSFVIKSTGNLDLEIKSLTMGPATSYDFTMLPFPANPKTPFTLKPGAEQKIIVQYDSTDVKDDKGTILVENNATPKPKEVLLEALAKGCDLQVKPPQLHFTGQGVRTITLANKGNEPCIYQKTSLSPGTSQEFRFDKPPHAAQKIDPGASLLFAVRCLFSSFRTSNIE